MFSSELFSEKIAVLVPLSDTSGFSSAEVRAGPSVIGHNLAIQGG